MSALQVLHQDQWADIHPIPRGLVINIGDLLQLVSNGIFISSNHIALAVGPRISSACIFIGPVVDNGAKIYGPIKELISEENPPICKEVVLDEYVSKFFNAGLDNYRALDYYNKNFAGTPGTWTGLLLRIAQCLFAAASIASMATTTTFFNYTAFCYLIASMGLQVIWSLGLALMDAYALLRKKILHNPIVVSLFAIGDWVTATLSLAASASSAGITVLYFGDLGGCGLVEECTKYEMAVAFAFLSWMSIAISSLIMFWLVAAG